MCAECFCHLKRFANGVRAARLTEAARSAAHRLARRPWVVKIGEKNCQQLLTNKDNLSLIRTYREECCISRHVPGKTIRFGLRSCKASALAVRALAI